jgi:hypothetical protein
VAFYTAKNCGAKKGGVNDLGKLRRGAKRNGAILTLLTFALAVAPCVMCNYYYSIRITAKNTDYVINYDINFCE